MSKTQRIVVGLAALLAWAMLIGVSLTANARFGWSLGSSDLERILLAAGSVASDLLKAGAPIAFLWFVAQKRKWPATAAAMIGIVTFAFSLIAATGFVAGERFAAYDKARIEAEAYQNSKAELDRAKAKRDWGPVARPASVVRAEIVALEGDRVFQVTARCTKTPGGDLEQWCRNYRRLGVELATAEEAEKAEAKVATASERTAKAHRTSGDYQVGFLSSLTGAKDGTILIGLTFLMVALIEIGASFGLTVALSLLYAPESKMGKVLSIVRPGKVTAPDPTKLKLAVGDVARPKLPAPAAPAGGGLRAKMKAAI